MVTQRMRTHSNAARGEFNIEDVLNEYVSSSIDVKCAYPFSTVEIKRNNGRVIFIFFCVTDCDLTVFETLFSL